MSNEEIQKVNKEEFTLEGLNSIKRQHQLNHVEKVDYHLNALRRLLIG